MKKYKSNVLNAMILLVVLIIFYSCEKEKITVCSDDGCLVFEGVITDLNDNLPIQGAEVS